MRPLKGLLSLQGCGILRTAVWVSETWTLTPVLSLKTSVSLDKSLYLPGPQFPHLQKEKIKSDVPRAPSNSNIL